MGFVDYMFDVSGNLDLSEIFVQSWFFGSVDFGFIFILFAVAFLLNRFNAGFGVIATICLLLALVFATISMSVVMWGVVIVIAVISGLRLLTNILLRV
jgi:hypothetical protein